MTGRCYGSVSWSEPLHYQLSGDLFSSIDHLVPNDFTLHHIDDKFAYIRGMVGDPFVIFADKCQADCPGNGPWIFEHERDKFSKGLFRARFDHRRAETQSVRQCSQCERDFWRR